MKKPCLVIAGASGFLGRYALAKLEKNYRIKALCRNIPKQNSHSAVNNIEWVKCDLFSLKEAEKALEECDYLLYLIHSMSKGSRLTQSSFPDLDLIIADNVSRAARKNRVKQIIYVGGIIPETTEVISKHLKSREEVETVLRLSAIPLTSIRAGIIIGAGGSSFQIVYRLVKKLKIMIAPKWTESLSQPVDVHDVIDFVDKCLGNENAFFETIDVHGCGSISYNNLIREIAYILKLKRYIFTIPFFRLGLSKLWLYLITRIDYHTISPLVDSLKYNLNAKNSALFDQYIPNPIKLSESLKNHIEIESNIKIKNNIRLKDEKTVRSVQRLQLPQGWNAINLAQEYIKWLPKLFFTIIKVETDKKMIYFKFFNLKLLTLFFSKDRSTPDRQLFYIVGGLFVIQNQLANARMEFRICPHENSALAAIHDYYPSLPWYLYRIFQANGHYFVMYMFNNHLKKISLSQQNSAQTEIKGTNPTEGSQQKRH